MSIREPIIFCLLAFLTQISAASQDAATTTTSNTAGSVVARVQQPKGADPALAELTVDDAVRIGLSKNPQITAGLAALASASATYRSYASVPNPQLGVTRVQGSSNAPSLDGANQDTFIDVGEMVDTSGQRRYQAYGARAQRDVSRYTLDETRLNLEQQIRDAYWSLAASKALTKYSQDSMDEAQRINKLIQTQFNVGSSPQVDVIRSSIDVANARQALVAAQGSEQTALADFNTLLARQPAEPVTIASSIEGAAGTGAASPAPDLATVTRTALANRPLVKSATEQVRVADYAVKQVQASRFPDLSVSYERSLQQSSDSLLLSISLPLFDLGATRNLTRAAEETHKQVAAQKAQAEQRVTQQVAQAVRDESQAQTQLSSYLNDILKPSQKLLDMAQIGYQNGATGILPVIDAESTLRSARTGYINAMLSLLKAQDEMRAAIGSPAAP